MFDYAELSGKPGSGRLAIPFDATRPVPILGTNGGEGAKLTRRNQHLRRSQILATIRALLMNEGFDGITVRDVAKHSGYAVQTVYNLVGPRDVAIADAIYDFTHYVGWQTDFDHFGPDCIAQLFERQIQAIEAQPEFCRQVCKIYFSDSREVFYNFRDRQISSMRRLLNLLRQAGAIREDANTGELAEDILVYGGAICIEWTDRQMPFERLRDRLYGGYARILSTAVTQAGTVLCDALAARRFATLN